MGPLPMSNLYWKRLRARVWHCDSQGGGRSSLWREQIWAMTRLIFYVSTVVKRCPPSYTKWPRRMPRSCARIAAGALTIPTKNQTAFQRSPARHRRNNRVALAQSEPASTDATLRMVLQLDGLLMALGRKA